MTPEYVMRDVIDGTSGGYAALDWRLPSGQLARKIATCRHPEAAQFPKGCLLACVACRSVLVWRGEGEKRLPHRAHNSETAGSTPALATTFAIDSGPQSFWRCCGATIPRPRPCPVCGVRP